MAVLRSGGAPEISRRRQPIDIYTNRGCVFVPEGRRILAGGVTTGTASTQWSSPERATDQSLSAAPAGAGWSFQLVPVVTPPANIHSPFGAKGRFRDLLTVPRA